MTKKENWAHCRCTSPKNAFLLTSKKLCCRNHCFSAGIRFRILSILCPFLWPLLWHYLGTLSLHKLIKVENNKNTTNNFWNHYFFCRNLGFRLSGNFLGTSVAFFLCLLFVVALVFLLFLSILGVLFCLGRCCLLVVANFLLLLLLLCTVVVDLLFSLLLMLLLLVCFVVVVVVLLVLICSSYCCCCCCSPNTCFLFWLLWFYFCWFVFCLV